MNEENKKIISEGNRKKAVAGRDLDLIIDKLLSQLKDAGIIDSYEKEVSFKHKDFPYPKQFLANFLIKTLDGKYIVIRRTTSFRGDRTKIAFYDFEGIVKYSPFSGNIVASIYLLPNSELNNRSFVQTKKAIKNKEYYSPATHLFTIDEFVQFLEGYKYSIESQTSTDGEGAEKDGRFYAKKGNELEKELSAVMSNPDFLSKYKSGILKQGYYKTIMDGVLKYRGCSVSDVVRVEATNSIPLLNSGGNPKTDIMVSMDLSDGRKFLETISIKNTKENRVSCHDYKVEDFIRVLQCDGTLLAVYLKAFQQAGSKKQLKTTLGVAGKSIEEFDELLEQKATVLTEWALTGRHDTDNLAVPEQQISQYLLINSPTRFAFYPMAEYIDKLFLEAPLTFGVPFSWTYPSKQRGKRIQLKLPVLWKNA